MDQDLPSGTAAPTPWKASTARFRSWPLTS